MTMWAAGSEEIREEARAFVAEAMSRGFSAFSNVLTEKGGEQARPGGAGGVGFATAGSFSFLLRRGRYYVIL
jgi:hypothetical protein